MFKNVRKKISSLLRKPPRESIDKFEEKILESLITAYIDASKRTRQIFLILNIAGIIIFIAEFNRVFSWLHYFRENKNLVKDPQQESFQNIIYDKFELIEIPVIGIQFSVSDIILVGMLGFVVIATWYYFSARRQHHVVSELLERSRNSDNLHIKRYLYFGIVNQSVFLTGSDVDTIDFKKKSSYRIVAQILQAFLVILPFSLIAFELFRLYNYGGFYPDGKMCWDMTKGQRTDIIVRLIIGLALGLYSFNIWNDIRKLMEATKWKLREMGREAEVPEKG
ncbi:hypothetical protein MYP_1218 [Sporocytophaga myxococcoides]|uniref:Uncharacterized protein n=1 Tax=Sporocytophaga myxococcoides TaxID=153721 RepID=A0A098LAP2_9BACT|nr:hypothetical protein [Sporocytophaga myxococcoides]GAL83990.1 hypothetical protein MYP_1218 [Sporocytophaga myxococcoides]